MKEKKIDKSPTEELKSLKRTKKVLFASEIGSAVAPFGVLTAINFKTYFIETEAWRTSITFAMLAFMTFVSASLIANEKLKKLNLLSSFIILAVIDGLLWFMGNLILELAEILLFVIFGFAGSLAIETVNRKKSTRIKELEEGIEKAKTDIIAEQYKEELASADKIKIKIKE